MDTEQIIIILFILVCCGYFIYEYLKKDKIIPKNNVLDHSYYINLEHRNDRKEETLNELSKFGIHNPIRLDAIKDNVGAIGCTKSHLKILKEARKNNYPYITIFEDDVEFLNPNETNQKLNNIINSNIEWDVILLGGNNYEPYHRINEDCIRVENCQTTTSYIVKKDYYDTLISHWEEGLQKLIETKDEPKYALDQYWKLLQKKDNFLLIIPLNVIQRDGYSDIVKQDVSYKEWMLKHN
mgnify:CR=1 FL=1